MAASSYRSRSRSRGRDSGKRRESLQRSIATAARAGWRGSDSDRAVSLKPREQGKEVSLRARSRSRERHHAQPRHLDKGKAKGKGKDKGKGGVPGTPPPRPAFDHDERLRKFADDPRYFEGALLGKAQLAALGKTGLSGRNTASFYAKDTLVRPSMRLFYGPLQKRYEGKQLDYDDVVSVPDFFCAPNDFGPYEDLLREVKALKSGKSTEVEELPVCQLAVKKLCKYFSIGDEGRAVRISRHRDLGDQEPFEYTWGSFRSRPSKSQNCLAVLTFGANREMAFRRSGTEELLYLSLFNGSLSLFGRDVCRRWQYGVRTASNVEQSMQGFISISVFGYSSDVVEDTVLAPAPSDAKRETDPFDGRAGVVFHDIARPSLRILTVRASKRYEMPVSHDDVIVVPEFLCAENDWSIYYTLIDEMRRSQKNGDRRAEWISWHEGAHLLSQNPTGSPTYSKVVDKIAEYFSVAKDNRGTRFNWYVDDSDWKPFHHDSAAFNEQRAKSQNATIGISFGAPRELAFRHAKTGELLYFPQKNGMLFYFGRDANIIWQHGINAMPKEQQGGKGRISVILWGLCTTTFEEAGSPPMLSDESRKGKGGGKGGWGHDMHKTDGPCRDYARVSCSYGDRCRFSHR